MVQPMESLPRGAPAARRPGRPAPSAGLLDLVDQAVLICTGKGVLTWCNAAARRMFPGARPGEPVGGPLGEAVAGGADRFETDTDGLRLTGHRAPPEQTARLEGLDGADQVWLVRDDSAVRAREEALLAERARSAYLAEAGRQLAASLHHGRALRTLARVATPVMADIAMVVLPPRGPRVPWYRGGPQEVSGQLPVEVLERVPAVAHALAGAVAQPEACAARELAPLGVALPQLSPGTRALVVTLPGAGSSVGALILLRGPRRPGFGAADRELVRQFATRAGVGLAAATLYAEQVHTVAVLQESLEPAPLPRAAGVQLGAAWRPARETLRVGGDFYQVRAAQGGGVEFSFGDVCGKGVEAAVFAGRVQQSLRILGLVDCGPLRALDLLNQALLEGGAAPFTTLVIGSARPAPDGALDVRVAGGGHLPPLVLRGDGRVESVHIGGMLVGVLPEPVFDEARLRLAPGDTLLLYSDGVTEARGGPGTPRMYGEGRLARDLATCAGMPAGAVAERVDLLVGQWLNGAAHDDIAVLAVQAPAPGGGR